MLEVEIGGYRPCLHNRRYFSFLFSRQANKLVPRALCTAKRCYADVNFSFVMFEPTFTANGFFFLRNKPGEAVLDDIILTCIYTIQP